MNVFDFSNKQVHHIMSCFLNVEIIKQVIMEKEIFEVIYDQLIMYSHRMELFFYENQILTRFCYNIDEVLFDLYVYARRCLVFKYKDYKGQVEIPVDIK